MKPYSPAADRNKAPIFDVLSPWLKSHARVLEIASGTGQHAEYFCQQRPDLFWQPTDAAGEGAGNLTSLAWSVLDPAPPELHPPYDAIVNINMIHIAPWEACLALLQHAQVMLGDDGILFFYGPFFVRDQETAPSNLDFHRSLQERNSQWGLRALEHVITEARGRRVTCWFAIRIFAGLTAAF